MLKISPQKCLLWCSSSTPARYLSKRPTFFKFSFEKTKQKGGINTLCMLCSSSIVQLGPSLNPKPKSWTIGPKLTVNLPYLLTLPPQTFLPEGNVLGS